MTQEVKKRATAKLSHAKVHWSVHVLDKGANVGIRAGGLLVVFAVLGLVAFIFSQVLPLFQSSGHGEMIHSAPPLKGGTLLLHSDEYTRVALRVTNQGEIQTIATPTGAVMSSVRIPQLGQASPTCAHVSLRPFALATIDGVQNVPRYSLTLGLSDGRALQGTISYLHVFKRFALNQDPESWRKLRMPEKDEYSKPDYQPEILVEKEATSLGDAFWLVEHLNEFGFYRKTRALVTIDRELTLPLKSDAVAQIYSATPKGEPDAEREVLTAAITQSGRALLVLEKLAINGMTEEIEAETLWSGDVSGEIKGKAIRCICHELLDEAIFGTEDGLLSVFRRGQDADKKLRFARPDALPPTDVFAFEVDSGRKWAEAVAAQREDLELGAPVGELRLTALEYLLGGISILVGDSHGGVQSWFPVRETAEDNDPRLRRIHVHQPGAGSVTGFSACESNKSFLAWDEGGLVRAIHNTSERVIFEDRISAPGALGAYYGAKAGGALAVDSGGKLRRWWIDAKHSEVSFKALFGSVWYEGYSKPKHEWQTSSGTDDVEAKYSLVPLIWGSIKGGLYALLFAIPLAVLGAIYTSEFMHRNLRAVVKPTMEVMASLPSVVLGFLGALYFAPMAAPIMPTLLVMVVLCPLLFLFFGWIWQQLPPTFTGKFGPKATLFMLLAILMTGVFSAGVIGPRVEDTLFPAVEGADPALLDAKTFKPINADAARQLDAGNFRSWTNGGANLPRATKVRDTELPAGWWIPGGHNLFAAIILLPLALLLAFMLNTGSAVLFGGTAFKRVWPGVIAAGNPLTRLRQKVAGESRTGVWPVAIDVAFSVGFAALCLSLALGLALVVAPGLELILFGYHHPTAGYVADFRRFVTGPEGWKFNQTNSLIVGFSMGFAVIPIIYSIAEDALSTVPNQLRAASLACGASRWQTTVTVVAPAAASGIFSAIVIGLGRALGETMIVVMAAGGTPVTELEPLSGFRSLSAAIAIEMPEAPHGGTLYRTLFLGGLMLFAVTFLISTLAEVVRMRLRKKLSRM